MTAFTSTSPAARIGKLKGDILKHAMPAEVLGITGQQRMMPKNQSKTISHRMYLPYGAATRTGTRATALWWMPPRMSCRKA